MILEPMRLYMQVLDPQVLVEKQTEILAHAKTSNIQEVKVFGKHVGQNIDLQGNVSFLIIPFPTATTWHQRVFKVKLDQLLGPPVEIYTESDLNDLVRQDVITSSQNSEYVQHAVSLIDFNNYLINQKNISFSCWPNTIKYSIN
jgi:predicted nucleotidyltransferase